MKKSKLVRFTSLAMSVMMVATTFLATFVVPAGAAESLPYIETIKETKQLGNSAFKIAEIAPSTDTGNMGYYVKGQEPHSIAGWDERISEMFNSSERTAYVNNILNKLSTTGIISNAVNAAPLHNSGDYKEHYPWDSDAANYIGDNAGTPATRLNLTNTEIYSVPGNIVELPDETGGDYNVSYNYSLSQDENLFNYSEWRFSKSAALCSNANGDTITFDEKNEALTIKQNGSGSKDVYASESYGYGYYVMKAEPNTKYKLSYHVEVDKGSDQIYIFGRDAVGSNSTGTMVNNGSLAANTGFYEGSGDHEHIITTGSTCRYFTIRLGSTEHNSTATFSKISLIKEENIFSYYDWKNSKSSVLGGQKSSGDTITFDDSNMSFTIKEDGEGEKDVYTNYSASDGYYRMNVEPNTEYTVSYTVNCSNGGGQFFVFGYDALNHTPNTLIYNGSSVQHIGFRPITTGNQTATFKTGPTCKYIQVRFGGFALNQTVIFSNIVIKKSNNNIFDFNRWANNPNTAKLYGTITEGDFLQVYNDQKVIHIAADGSRGYDFQTGGSTLLNQYSMDVDGATKYQISFNLDGDNSGRVIVYGFNALGTASRLSSSDGKLTTLLNPGLEFRAEPGTFNDTFFTSSDTVKLTVVFAPGNINEQIKFNNIEIKPYSFQNNADSVQIIDRFEYGQAETVYGPNLFDFNKWATNTYSNKMGDQSTTTISYDFANSSVRMTNTNGYSDISTRYGTGVQYYFMNCEPNTKYRVSIKATVTKGAAQFYVFPCSSGITLNQSNTGAVLTRESDHTTGWANMCFRGINSTKSFTEFFTTSNDCIYLQIRVGVDNPNSDVTISDISIQKVENPENYYYSVIPTEYRYGVKNPPEGTVLYEKDSDGHYVYYGVMGDKGVDIYTSKTYYSLEPNPTVFPSRYFSGTTPYRAISSGFRKAGNIEDEDGLVIGEETAYFVSDFAYLIYVGDKTGNANLDTSGDGVQTVYTNIVYYTGGFENNQWFKYRVLDADDKNEDGTDKYTFPISVSTITPDDEALNATLTYADLIVITAGTDLINNGADAKYKKTVNTGTGNETIVCDIPDDTIDLIIATVQTYINNKMPVIVDANLLVSSDCPPNLKKLVESITTSSAGTVKGSVFIYNGAQLGTDHLVTNKFITQIAGQQNDHKPIEGAAFYDVAYEIYNEDIYRSLRGLTNLTGEQDKVNIATVIRYIINYKKQRAYNQVSTLKILDIEPGSTFSSLGATEPEKCNTIRSMLPASMQYENKNITIVTMSTAEFLGKNEAFEEEYDIVYIGADNTNMNTVTNNCSFKYKYKSNPNSDVYDSEATATVTNGVFDNTYKQRVATGAAKKFIVGSPIYNDTNMNGMYYTNVGDNITTGTVALLNWNEGIEYPALSGLLKSDYVNIGESVREFTILGMNAGDWITDALDDVGLDLDSKYWVEGGHATFRTSGNDINLTSMARLQSFVDSGRPVIVADQLTSMSDDQTFSVTATMSMSQPNSSVYKFTFDAKLDQEASLPDDYVIRYNWEKIDENGNVTVLKTDRPTGECEVTSSTGKVQYVNEAYIYTLDCIGTYYCWVSISHGGKNLEPVKSNTIDIKYDREDRTIYLRTTHVGKDGIYKKYGNYIDVEGGLPNGWTAKSYWMETGDSILHTAGTFDDDKDKNWDKRELTDNYHLTKHERARVKIVFTPPGNSDALTLQVKKKVPGRQEGSLTPFLYSRPSGKGSESGYPYADLSTGKHKRHDSNMYNGQDDYNPSGGFDVPFVFSLGTVKYTVNNDKRIVNIHSPSEINPDAVDNCSYMFQFLLKNYYRDNKGKKSGSGSSLADNVFNVSDAKNNTSLLEDCLNNIARPRIEWQTDIDSVQYPRALTSDTITLEYYIWDDSNISDKTTYTANVYLDINSDGKFVESEIRSGYAVATNKISRGNNKNLNRFQFKLDNMKPGIIPWKIVLTENVDPNTTYQGRISYTGYSYIKPTSADDVVEIKALMVLPGAWSTSYNKIDDLVKQKAKLTIDGKAYTVKDNYWGANAYMGCVFNSETFDDGNIENLRRLTAEELNCDVRMNGKFQELVSREDGLLHTGFEVNGGDIRIDIAVTNIHDLNKIFKEKGADSAYLKKFSMLILGFGDSWGSITSTWNDFGIKDSIIREGLELNTALAIVDFINEGIPTLFCHDTLNTQVNFVSLYWDKMKSSAMKLGQKVFKAVDKVIGWINDLFGSRIKGFTISDDEMKDTKVKDGYWNNLIMREVLGLDRYGITHAITTRAKAIYNGYDDTDAQNAKYKNDKMGTYGNDILGRAYMYETIYDYKVKNVPADLKDEYDLSVERMLDTNHSIAWVPGSAQTYKKYDGDTNQSMTVTYSPTHALRSGEQVVEKFGDVWLVAKPTTVKTLVGYDTNKDPIYEEKPGWKDYRYTGVVYEKQRIVTEDPFDYSVTVSYTGVPITHDTDIYNGQPVVDTNGNILGQYDRYTQGFTDYVLQRYMDHDSNVFDAIKYSIEDPDSARPLISTDKVTQVNRGRITTYPYDINDDDLFDLYGKSSAQYKEIMDRTQSIKMTHESVYQVNPNGDDITVWYALAGDNYYNPTTSTGIRNNCTSGYYLYSRGNLTYTGAGHTNQFSEFEAKLFINTLVAAYTTVCTVPSAEYRNSVDTAVEKYLLIIPEYNSDSSLDSELAANDDIYFKITDTNASAEIYCEFYYFDKDGNKKVVDPSTCVFKRVEKSASNPNEIALVEKVVNGKKVLRPMTTNITITNSRFMPGTLYALEVPAEIYQLFKGDSSNTYQKIDLYAKPTAHVKRLDAKEGTPPEIMEGDPVKIEIRKLELSNLS